MDIDGKKVALEIKEEIRQGIKANKLTPGLAFVLIGEDPPSQTYVRMKEKACQEVGIFSKKIELPGDVSEKELTTLLSSLNEDPKYHGILVQMPLPKHLDTLKILTAIDPTKDVDGFHPLNIGKMVAGDPTGFLPCTPFGIIKLLEAYKIKTEGKEALVLGRSLIVGRPIAHLLSQKAPFGNATVTLAHSHTKDLKALCKQADILVAAMGNPLSITADMVKPGAVVIDVGITRKGTKIVGDVDYENVSKVASYITPVPGGVGPMTIAMLLYNTYLSAKSHSEKLPFANKK
ncbi:MAG: bifunctional methylenetetrahydrofolate dehydrogenase/methenyltetrahydrofolate cyclohydrolase FolD [Verrucomicrobia bacterium]|nr:bifunctional methylenetetrahydrofolate dehydrogenase/methenyltetrahydrofolate cyclohydrolase FolD [Verrucomicrobiota bacterium]